VFIVGHSILNQCLYTLFQFVVKFAAWPTSWRPPGTDRHFRSDDPKCTLAYGWRRIDSTVNIVLGISIIIILLILWFMKRRGIPFPFQFVWRTVIDVTYYGMQKILNANLWYRSSSLKIIETEIRGKNIYSLIAVFKHYYALLLVQWEIICWTTLHIKDLFCWTGLFIAVCMLQLVRAAVMRAAQTEVAW